MRTSPALLDYYDRYGIGYLDDSRASNAGMTITSEGKALLESVLTRAKPSNFWWPTVVG